MYITYSAFQLQEKTQTNILLTSNNFITLVQHKKKYIKNGATFEYSLLSGQISDLCW